MLTEQVQAPKIETRKLLQLNKKFLIDFFLGEFIDKNVPDIHEEILELMCSNEVEKLVLAIPRGHAKTTLMKLAAVYWFLFNDAKFVVYLSSTAENAINACKDIIGFLQSPNFEAIFGPLEFVVEQFGEGYFEFYWEGKKRILRAQGVGKSTRGLNINHNRPDVALVDDMETETNIDTDHKFEKLKAWWESTFQRALRKMGGHKIIMSGNLIFQQSILFDSINDSDWHSRLWGVLREDGTPLWPDLWTIDEIRKDYQKAVEKKTVHLWFAEMMNQPSVNANGLIKPEEIYYAPRVDPQDIKYGFNVVDPAISKKKSADDCVTMTHGWVEADVTSGDGYWQIVDYVNEKGVDQPSLFSRVVDQSNKWRVFVTGIESVQYQAAISGMFAYLAQIKGIDYLEFVDVYPYGQEKTQRIIPFINAVKAGLWRINEGDFTLVHQMLTYDPQKKENQDDVLDAAAYGLQMAERYLPLIMQSLYKNKPSGEKFTGAQIAKF